MAKSLIMVGAGGFVRTLKESINPALLKLEGFIDDDKNGEWMGLPIFGSKIEDVPSFQDRVYFISIGRSIEARERWYKKIKAAGCEMANIIDGQAYVSANAEIGTGNFIGKFAIINGYAVIGDNNIINQRAMISPSVHIGSHCNIATTVTVNGESVIGDCCLLGSGSVINGQLSVGSHVTIGSGGVVVRDMESNVTAVGVPVKVIKRRSGD